jgi:hypothetical protein
MAFTIFVGVWDGVLMLFFDVCVHHLSKIDLWLLLLFTIPVRITEEENCQFQQDPLEFSHNLLTDKAWIIASILSAG